MAPALNALAQISIYPVPNLGTDFAYYFRGYLLPLSVGADDSVRPLLYRGPASPTARSYPYRSASGSTSTAAARFRASCARPAGVSPRSLA